MDTLLILSVFVLAGLVKGFSGLGLPTNALALLGMLVAPGEAAALIRQGEGPSGRNVDYLTSLIDHLAELGIRDRGLGELAARV